MNVKYIVKLTGKFRKDYKQMERRNLDMSLLYQLIFRSFIVTAVYFICSESFFVM